RRSAVAQAQPPCPARSGGTTAIRQWQPAVSSSFPRQGRRGYETPHRNKTTLDHLVPAVAQDHLAYAGRQGERKLEHSLLHWHAQYEFLLLFPSANPAVFRTKKNPSRRFRGTGVELDRVQAAGGEKFLYLDQ